MLLPDLSLPLLQGAVMTEHKRAGRGKDGTTANMGDASRGEKSSKAVWPG